MPLIPFPNVPKLPGVPAIPRLPSVSTASSVLRVATSIVWRAFAVDKKWGIYDKNGKALGDQSKVSGIIGGVLDTFGIGSMLSTYSLDYVKETKISDFPVEKGKFAAYNKVEMPANPKVRINFQGSEKDRAAFINQIDKACKSTDLYSVVTPEVTYIDYSIETYNYSRSAANGVNLYTIDLSLKEIRQVKSSYSQSDKGQVQEPKDPGASPTTDAGKVQPQEPKQSVLKQAATKLGL